MFRLRTWPTTTPKPWPWQHSEADGKSMSRAIPTRRPRPSEEGYILIWVIFLLAVLTIAMSVAVPRIAKEIQLDRERETMARGKQYTRAVQLYYRKFHAFPPNPDALVKTNEIRFLRRKYIDPTTGKDDWKPIRFGQAKTQTLGFFGQPIAGAGSAGGTVLAGTGPSGGNGLNGSTSLFSPTSSGAGSTPAAGAPGVSTGSTTTAGSGSSPGTDTGLSGQTFGGAGIIGFSPAGTKQSIMIYKKKNRYDEWEFVYDPLTDMRTQSGNTGTIGQPASSTTTPIGTTPTTPIGTTPTTPTPQQ
jgi:type II secretory pathway pseudopilin PulG